jgi:ribonucleoside-diphosphate reductase alpha chain
MTRERLPDVRAGKTHHFCIITRTLDGEGVEEIDGYLTVGLYGDGRVGELFLKAGKAGEFLAALDAWAICASVALQSGVPLEALCRKFVGQRFWPFGATTNPEIPRCTSVLDYASRWLLAKYSKPADDTAAKETP